MRNRLFIPALLLAAPLGAGTGQMTPKSQAVVACSNTKLYHRADCKWVKEIDKAGTRVDFPSAAAAKKAGYKACTDCKP